MTQTGDRVHARELPRRRHAGKAERQDALRVPPAEGPDPRADVRLYRGNGAMRRFCTANPFIANVFSNVGLSTSTSLGLGVNFRVSVPLEGFATHTDFSRIS